LDLRGGRNCSKQAAKSIDNYIGLMKLIVASTIDENGEEICPRKLNHEFIDLPEVKNQNTPTFTSQQVTDIVAKAEEQTACYFSWPRRLVFVWANCRVLGWRTLQTVERQSQCASKLLVAASLTV
jgi:hypothetical protein